MTISLRPLGSFSNRDPGRHPLCVAPVPGLMQTCRPVVGGRKVDWSGITAELPEAGLDELDRMRVVRCDGALDDLRLRRRRRLVAVSSTLISVHGRRCSDGLPDVSERRLVQGGLASAAEADEAPPVP